jgi:predicted enzyme related to lactoylglutathione lyase
MSRVIHFEFPADNPERAVKFYEDVFGWKIEKWGGPQDYWLVGTGEASEPGIDGAIARRQDINTVVNTMSVPSFDEAARKITDAGGKVITPRMAVTGVGYMAYCTDTEGTKFGIMEMDPNAK